MTGIIKPLFNFKHPPPPSIFKHTLSAPQHPQPPSARSLLRRADKSIQQLPALLIDRQHPFHDFAADASDSSAQPLDANLTQHSEFQRSDTPDTSTQLPSTIHGVLKQLCGWGCIYRYADGVWMTASTPHIGGLLIIPDKSAERKAFLVCHFFCDPLWQLLAKTSNH